MGKSDCFIFKESSPELYLTAGIKEWVKVTSIFGPKKCKKTKISQNLFIKYFQNSMS